MTAIMTTHDDCDGLDYLGCSFLEDLLPFIEAYTVCNESHFLSIVTSPATRYNISNIPSEFLLFRTSEETIHTILNQTNPCLSKYLSSFDLNAKLLLAKMPSIPHSVAGSELHTILINLLQPMGLGRAIKGYPGADIWGNREKRGKEPDYGWNPKRRPPGQADRPSVVLEVAYSESDLKLQSDIRFWLSPKDGNANVCLTIRIDRTRPQIRVEQWHRDKQGRIRRRQVIWITRTADKLTATGDSPLLLAFEDLFRHKPDQPREHDIEISAESLMELARAVWDDYSL